MTKVCSRCKQELPLEKFGKNKSRKDGLTNYCKACYAEYAYQWKAANPERVHERVRQWHATHPEAYRRYYRKYRDANLEKERERKRQSYAANPEPHRERSRQWRQTNPEKHKAHNHTRRVRIANNGGGTYTKADWELILWIYDNRCLMCGATFLPQHLTIDHIISIVNGGTNDPGNLQPLCHSCNSSKGKKTIDLRDVRDRRNIK